MQVWHAALDSRAPTLQTQLSHLYMCDDLECLGRLGLPRLSWKGDLRWTPVWDAALDSPALTLQTQLSHLYMCDNLECPGRPGLPRLS